MTKLTDQNILLCLFIKIQSLNIRPYSNGKWPPSVQELSLQYSNINKIPPFLQLFAYI